MNRTLARSLRFRDLILIVIGTTIGSGIFLVPGTVLEQVGGSIRLALLVWLIGGVLSLLGALTYGELGAATPEAGGIYVHVRDAFGPLPAFLYGWTSFLVIGSGAVATLAVAFSSYLRQLVPVSPLMAKVVAIAMIAVVMAVNVRGTRHGANVQNWSTALKVGGILIMSAALIAASIAAPPVAPAAPPTSPVSLLTGIGLAMIGVLWAYEGWQWATFSAGETIEPQRTFPLGIIIGTAALIGIYLLANVAYFSALGAAGAVASERIAADAMSARFGSLAGKAIALMILISMFSSANGTTLTTPRVYFAMARDGVFFRKLAEVHPRFGTPAFAVVASSLWAMVLAASGTFEQLLTYVVFVGWIFYALGATAIFVQRRRRPDASRPFRVPGYPVTPMLFVLSAAIIVINTLITQPRRAAVGLAIVLLGVPVYYWWRKDARAR